MLTILECKTYIYFSDATTPTTPKLVESSGSVFSGSSKVPYERTLSLPVDPCVQTSFSSLMDGNSSDSSAMENPPSEETTQPVHDNGLLIPTFGSGNTIKGVYPSDYRLRIEIFSLFIIEKF